MKYPMPRPEPRRKPTPVTVEQTSLLAWQTALELADGDAHRLERLSEKEVLVHNTRVTKRGA